MKRDKLQRLSRRCGIKYNKKKNDELRKELENFAIQQEERMKKKAKKEGEKEPVIEESSSSIDDHTSPTPVKPKSKMPIIKSKTSRKYSSDSESSETPKKKKHNHKKRIYYASSSSEDEKKRRKKNDKEKKKDSSKTREKIYVLTYTTDYDPKNGCAVVTNTNVFSSEKKARESMEDSIDEWMSVYDKDSVKRDDSKYSVCININNGEYYHNWEIKEESVR